MLFILSVYGSDAKCTCCKLKDKYIYFSNINIKHGICLIENVFILLKIKLLLRQSYFSCIVAKYKKVHFSFQQAYILKLRNIISD
jgi:hypothetical protein